MRQKQTTPASSAEEAIKDILGSARQSLFAVDGYVGTNLLLTLRGLEPSALSVRLLTNRHSVKQDFPAELAAFRRQFPSVDIELRTSESFLDRFIVIDGDELFHIGASLKDAGGRAFMISCIENPEIAATAKAAIEQAWADAKDDASSAV